MPKVLFALILSLFFFKVTAQTPSGEIYQNLKKLNVVGSVLYLAAHPDDENTLMLAYLSKDQLVRTGYLSLTRGDGGQNLIGSEQGYNIGLIRTQELLAARKNDGAEQLFSRAYDFGYSKTKEETLKFWDEKKVLGDVVWLIRKFQPDVIITRFPPDPRAGHGHHQTSAYLGEKAFSVAADPKAYPDQLELVKPWQAKRLVWNSYTPGFTNNKPGEKGDSYIAIEIGGYNPLLGKSYPEIAAESRSQHKSQAFGSAANRGKRKDYFLHKEGVPADKNLFDGIDISWNRVAKSEKVSKLIQETIEEYDLADPSRSVSNLLKIYKELGNLDENNNYVTLKKEEVKRLMLDCLGIWFETNPTTFSGVAGKPIDFKVNVIKRSELPIKLISLHWTGNKTDSILNVNLGNNDNFILNKTVTLPNDLPVSQPYWIVKPLDKGLFNIENQEDVGYPENRSMTTTTFTFEIEGENFSFTKPWEYKFTDPAEGEIYRPFEIRPLVTVTITDPVVVFPDATPKTVHVVVQAQVNDIAGNVSLNLPKGWKSEPAQFQFSISEKYQEAYYAFKVTPATRKEEIMVQAQVSVDGKSYNHSIKSISYQHIPTQTLYPIAEAKFDKIDIKTTAKKIGYIAGAGDEVPAALRQIGCNVTLLGSEQLAGNLQQYDAIVVGVRAYNTDDRLDNYQSSLLDYVKNGGTMVVQYTIPSNLKVKNLGPYQIQTGRDRITEEDAKLTFINPGHRLLNYPNKITQEDFEGWVQERGLYFADSWDKAHYEPILAGHDTGEEVTEGALLYAKYGKGHYIYTGLSFFRELPAGVSGAYRIFANLISVGK